MDVQAAVLRNGEHRLRQDQAIGRTRARPEVRGTFSQSGPWRPAVVARLARTLGSKMQVVGASQQIQRLRRELGSHEATAPQDANRTHFSSAFPRTTGSETSPEYKNTFTTRPSIPIFKPRIQSRLKSSAGNTPARAESDAANRGDTVSFRAFSRYSSAMLERNLRTNFGSAKRVQRRIRLPPLQAVVPALHVAA